MVAIEFLTHPHAEYPRRPEKFTDLEPANLFRESRGLRRTSQEGRGRHAIEMHRLRKCNRGAVQTLGAELPGTGCSAHEQPYSFEVPNMRLAGPTERSHGQAKGLDRR